MQLIEQIVQIYMNYPDLNTQVLAASIRMEATRPAYLADLGDVVLACDTMTLWRREPDGLCAVWRGRRDFSSERPYGWFAHGRHTWLLDDVHPLATPVPFKGGQGWSRSI
ncbi:MAG TPA: hypothetical protein PLV68_09915, partial [Ilumatobacteraceae bacterium]|nr:hypothetical protein [Ilumatobacteraceae bacterium]